jgi:hypothetical protein
MEMTIEQANQIKANYQKYDEAFRKAKARKDFKKASEYKAQRDALAAQFAEAVKVTK